MNNVLNSCNGRTGNGYCELKCAEYTKLLLHLSVLSSDNWYSRLWRHPGVLQEGSGNKKWSLCSGFYIFAKSGLHNCSLRLFRENTFAYSLAMKEECMIKGVVKKSNNWPLLSLPLLTALSVNAWERIFIAYHVKTTNNNESDIYLIRWYHIHQEHFSGVTFIKIVLSNHIVFRPNHYCLCKFH